MNDASQTSQTAASAPLSAGPISAGEQLTIHTIEAFAASCRASLAEATELTLDLGAVAACDTLGVQFLLAVRHSAAKAGKLVRFTNSSDAVRQAATAVACETLLSP